MIYGQPGHGYGPGRSGTPGTPEYYAPLPRPPLPPRAHYQATTALWLGLAAPFLGVLTGIPAILLGRRVLSGVIREPDRWLPSRAAKIAVMLGWFSVFETAAFVAMMATDGWRAGAAGIGIALVGLLSLAIGTNEKVPRPISQVTRALRRTPLAVGLSLAGVLVGSVLGPVVATRQARMAAQRCVEDRAHYAAAAKDGRFTALREAIAAIEADCNATEAELKSLRDDTSAKEADVKAKQAEVRARQEADELAAGAQLVAEKRQREEAAEQKRGAGSAAMYVVAQDHMFLFDTVASAKKASQLAARGSDAEFFEFVAEHGTTIAQGTRVHRVESTWFLYVRVRAEGSGHVGWISNEFLRRE